MKTETSLRLSLLAALALASPLLGPSSTRAQDAEAWPQLDLSLYGGVMIPSASDPHLDDVGLSFGLSAIVRTGSLFGLGLVLEHDRLGWQAQGPSGYAIPGSLFPDDDGAITHDLAALAARLYFVQLGPADAFAQLALGYSSLVYTPDHPDCSVEDGFAAQLALGVEWRLTRFLGAHTSLAAAPLAWGLGCNEVYYENMPPSPPFPKLGLSARIGITTVWDAP